jgi:hypothetical protein
VQGEDVRAGTVAALALALAVGALGACNTYKNKPETLPPGYEAGIYEAPPGRQVADDGGPITGGGGGSGGGTSVLNNDASPPDVASPAIDMAPPVGDAGSETGDNTCDLLAQNCGANRGCYPGPGGRATCQAPQPGTAPCTDSVSCAPGTICVDTVCTPLCNTVQPVCPSMRSCNALPMFPGVGYCLP